MKGPLIHLYEDDHFVAVSKPAGLLTVPSPKETRNTLVEKINREYDGLRIYPCHRLDRDTSGVILFAKSRVKERLMRVLFAERKVEKIYIAFVRGRLKQKSGTISRSVEDFHKKKFGKKRRPEPAITKYKVLEYYRGFSVVEARPVTGRTNQIRIHFQQLGHPLLGERIYAMGKDFPIKFRRCALHASQVRWIHPITDSPIEVTAPLPNDMKNFLEIHD